MRNRFRFSALSALVCLFALGSILRVTGQMAGPRMGMGMAMHPGFNQTVFNAATMGRGFAFVPPATMSGMMPPAASPAAGGYAATPAYQTNANPYVNSSASMRQSNLDTYGDPSRDANRAYAPDNRQTAKIESHALDVLGVPTRDGKLNWPLGLRILPPGEEVEPLRRQIDALAKKAAEYSAEGRSDPRLIEEARQAVDELRGLLHGKKTRFDVPYTYEEADRFLTRLTAGLKTLR
jgi:hypothetical protein